MISKTRDTLSTFAVLLLFFFTFQAGRAHAQSEDPLAQRIQTIISRPEFAHANFGIEFYSLDTGTLKGDLIFVASGDPNLSNRIQPDGTLAFVDEDHTYGGPALPGDPLAVIKQLAKDVASKGIHKIEGRVLIDASLFPDGPREGGTNVVVSSIMINDNVIDLLPAPGAKEGGPVSLKSSPQTSYVKLVNRLTTSAAGTKPSFDPPDFVTNADGSVTATLTGSLPVDSTPQPATLAVPSPTKYAETVFQESLVAAGVAFNSRRGPAPVDFTPLGRFYTTENQVAEHVSPPLSEEIKVTLKVSQNLHAGMGPYLLGALVAKDTKNPLDAGFHVEHDFLQSAKLDLSGSGQGDGAGGDWADLFSPDFMVHYLTYWTTRPDYETFFKALPVLGKDGTLAKIQPNSAGAGHVFAKTGTFGSEDKLNGKLMLNGKGLVGYVITKDNKRLAFAAYVNHVTLPPDTEMAQTVAGQALGEIAAAAYDADLEASAGASGAYDLLIRTLSTAQAIPGSPGMSQ